MPRLERMPPDAPSCKCGADMKPGKACTDWLLRGVIAVPLALFGLLMFSGTLLDPIMRNTRMGRIEILTGVLFLGVALWLMAGIRRPVWKCPKCRFYLPRK